MKHKTLLLIVRMNLHVLTIHTTEYCKMSTKALYRHNLDKQSGLGKIRAVEDLDSTLHVIT